MEAWNLRNNTNIKNPRVDGVSSWCIGIVGSWCGSGRFFKKSCSDHATTIPSQLSLGSIVACHFPSEIQDEFKYPQGKRAGKKPLGLIDWERTASSSYSSPLSKSPELVDNNLWGVPLPSIVFPFESSKMKLSSKELLTNKKQTKKRTVDLWCLSLPALGLIPVLCSKAHQG